MRTPSPPYTIFASLAQTTSHPPGREAEQQQPQRGIERGLDGLEGPVAARRLIGRPLLDVVVMDALDEIQLACHELTATDVEDLPEIQMVASAVDELLIH